VSNFYPFYFKNEEIMSEIIPISNPRIYIELREANIRTKWYKILYTGKFVHGKFGEFNITTEDLKQGNANFNAGVGVRKTAEQAFFLPGNYQHASFDANPEYAKASGRIHELKLEDDATWARIEWTEKAQEYITKKEFSFISPEFMLNFTDEFGKEHGFTFVGFALTNENFLKAGQTEVTLMAGAEPPLAASSNIATNTNQNSIELINKGNNMNPEILKLMGVSDEAQVLTKIQETLQMNSTLQEQVKKLTDEKAKVSVDLQAVNGRLAELEARQKLMDAEKVIDSKIFNLATNSGRIAPEQKEIWVKAYIANPEMTLTLIDSLPEIKATTPQGSGTAKIQLSDPMDELHNEAVKLMATDKSLKYDKAVAQVLNVRKDLKARYTSPVQAM
jgi:phage I-like protein